MSEASEKYLRGLTIVTCTRKSTHAGDDNREHKDGKQEQRPVDRKRIRFHGGANLHFFLRTRKDGGNV